MKLFTTLTLAAGTLFCTPLFAQVTGPQSTDPLPTDPPTEEVEKTEEEPSFSLTGYVDAYYSSSLINSAGANEDALLLPTSFSSATNTFGIGNVNLLAEKTMGDVSFVGQLGFGPRAVEANGDSNFGGALTGNFASTVQQLYVAYSPSDAVTITLGNFGTFIGYEVIDVPGNANYTMSYLFSNGPFYHTGVKADFAIAEGFGAMVGVFNDTDSKLDVVGGKHYGAQLSFESGGFAGYLSALAGKESEGSTDEDDDDTNEFQIDLTATYEVSESFMLGVNASNYSSSVDGDADGNGFFGTALYATYTAKENLAFSLRGEYFGATAAEGDDTDQPSVIALTANSAITIGDLTIVPEFRYDTGSNGFGFSNVGNQPIDADDTSALYFVVGAFYSF
ncbi:outer membrane beta-barrel protein [Lewinella sp. 4G2]|uniref:outer membrane beta-barrel protein n=1 Tax=Lewinella sp. 4G2 TaxID=1803372 RepID=UPI0007B4D08F|nr:outer membrane beta-barrel protein [Lewinella sp. 4G2]OAV46015.1 hypothetical protein A3850_017230 [Lewinella sp. 4G2]